MFIISFCLTSKGSATKWHWCLKEESCINADVFSADTLICDSYYFVFPLELSLRFNCIFHRMFLWQDIHVRGCQSSFDSILCIRRKFILWLCLLKKGPKHLRHSLVHTTRITHKQGMTVKYICSKVKNTAWGKRCTLYISRTLWINNVWICGVNKPTDMLFNMKSELLL